MEKLKRDTLMDKPEEDFGTTNKDNSEARFGKVKLTVGDHKLEGDFRLAIGGSSGTWIRYDFRTKEPGNFPDNIERGDPFIGETLGKKYYGFQIEYLDYDINKKPKDITVKGAGQSLETEDSLYDMNPRLLKNILKEKNFPKYLTKLIIIQLKQILRMN